MTTTLLNEHTANAHLAINKAAALAADLEAKGVFATIGKGAAVVVAVLVGIGLIIGLIIGFFIGRAVGRNRSE